jgi:hypothetical protein
MTTTKGYEMFTIYRTQPAGVDGPMFELEAATAEDALAATIDRLGLEDGWTIAVEGPTGSRVTLRHPDHRRYFYAYKPAPEAPAAGVAEVKRARRELNNLRGVVRRTGTTGRVNRTAKYNYRRAFAAVVALEDVLGVEAPEAIKASDRLLALRDEARRAGLLSYAEEAAAEREALA